MKTLKFWDLYHIMDRTIGIKHQRTFFGSQIWDARRVFSLLEREGYLTMKFDRRGLFTHAELTGKGEINPDFLCTFLNQFDGKKVPRRNFEVKKD